MRLSVFFVCIVSLLLLSACGECSKDSDCTAKTAFSASCKEKTCVYTAIPNQCGNLICELPENKCKCPSDCKPACVGKVQNSQYLSQQCIQDQCVEDVASSLIKPVSVSADQIVAGDKFKFDTLYNQPFNMKRDTFNLAVSISQMAPQNKDHHIISMEMTGTTKDGRTITLAQQSVDKYLWSVGSSVQEGLILDFTTVEVEGEISNLVLKTQYEYVIVQAGKKTPKQGIIQNKYKDKFVFVKPTASYQCPASCDDKNPGTKDTCGPQTNYFCMHEPVPNACGNFKCDGSENKCTCPQDCGVCGGSAGVYLDFVCKSNKCVAQLKSSVKILPNSIFDDRSLGRVQLNNNYRFNNPFDIGKDRLEIDFKVYRQDPTVSEVAIDTIRLLEGAQQISEMSVDEVLSDKPVTVSVVIPSIVEPEEEHLLTLAVWYRFTQDGQEKTGKFEKPLGKIILIRPE